MTGEQRPPRPPASTTDGEAIQERFHSVVLGAIPLVLLYRYLGEELEAVLS